jgi:hypothetical protein
LINLFSEEAVLEDEEPAAMGTGPMDNFDSEMTKGSIRLDSLQ